MAWPQIYLNNTLRVSQNFLRDPRVVNRLLFKTNITAQDIVYDIGGGKGVIADALAKRCHSVVCIELDPHLIPTLKHSLAQHANVVMYEADFLSLPLPQTPYKVFANIPFNMSADILHKLTRAPNPPSTTYLIVQREFAEKLLPATNGYSRQLSILLGAEFEIRVVAALRKSDFYPRPKVNTVLLEIQKRTNTLVNPVDIQLYRDFVTYAYNAFKPKVSEALRPVLTNGEFAALSSELRFPLSARPSNLSLEQWIGLLVAASRKPKLEEIVGGAEAAQIVKHNRRTKVHRTRP